MKFSNSRILRLERNMHGRDIVVGDVHGEFSALNDALNGIKFDSSIDRLISVGDLVDRGSQSELALTWLDYPWFFSVRGNHEQLAINYYRSPAGRFNGYIDAGGAWFAFLPNDEKRTFVDVFSSLPLVIEIETRNGLCGIIHADCPIQDWGTFTDWVRSTNDIKSMISLCMESRDRLKYNIDSPVSGIFQIYVGHSLVTKPVTLGNINFIETGGSYSALNYGKFTLIEL